MATITLNVGGDLNTNKTIGISTNTVAASVIQGISHRQLIR